MSKTTIVLAFGAGYVLGAKAGHGRYEQIKARATKVAENPRVQSAADTAREKAGEVATSVADTAKEKVSEAATAAKEKVQGDHADHSDPTIPPTRSTQHR